jgi:hypothetical protein
MCYLIHNINNVMYYFGDKVVVGQWYATTKISKFLNFGLKG